MGQIKAHEFFTSLECDAPKIKGLDWEKLMAMEHPVRRRARHSKGGARLARLRLGRPLLLSGDVTSELRRSWAVPPMHGRGSVQRCVHAAVYSNAGVSTGSKP